MAKQTFKLHSSSNFASYLKRFTNIEKSLLLEIDDNKFIAKTHSPDKAVVKISSILLTEIFDDVETAKRVKIGMYAVDNFTQTFKHLGDSDVKFEVSSEVVGGEETATQLRIYNKTLKFNFPGASPSMFKYIDKNLAEKIANTSSSLFSFRVDKDTLSKVSSLCSIDAENDTITLSAEKGEIFFSGKAFDLQLPGVSTEKEVKISFYKTHYASVDKEDSEVFVLDDKVIFKSLESETVIVIGKVA